MNAQLPGSSAERSANTSSAHLFYALVVRFELAAGRVSGHVDFADLPVQVVIDDSF